MTEHTLSTLAAQLRSGASSSVELIQRLLANIAQQDPNFNSFISLNGAQALTEAQQADELRSKGDSRPLLGVPFAHKDIFCVENIKTTAGSKMLDNFIPPYDATLVENCKKAGLISLGKTNMDEFAMGSSNENSYYGPVKNPWDVTRVPGGSSGGSAAAIAGRLIPAATGSDTGGSIRQPAAFCGITGLKPTYGRVSRYGMIAYASSLDQAGPMAHTAEDCGLLLQAMSGYDPRDSTSAKRPVDDYCQSLNAPIQGLKIGLVDEYMRELSPATARALEACIQSLTQLGVVFKSVSLPHSALALPVYYIIAPAECSSNLARYDGVRYGYRCQQPKDLEDLYCRSRSEAFGPEVKRRILMGTYVLSSGYYDAYYDKAMRVRRLVKQDFMEAFAQVDVILSPTTATTAFKLGEKTQDPVAMYQSDSYTIPANLAGLPALSMPAGFDGGLPLGMQLIGQYFKEAQLLNIAHRFQGVTDWHQQSPHAR